MATYTKDNRLEIPDPTPVEMPLGYEKPESLESMIARMVRNVSLRAEKHGAETFEESDDFDCDDDHDPVSQYQLNEMQEEVPYALRKPQHINKDPGVSAATAEAPQKPKEGASSVPPANPPEPAGKALA